MPGKGLNKMEMVVCPDKNIKIILVIKMLVELRTMDEKIV